MNLFLDSETTGVPEKQFRWDVDYLQYPYIVELAWIKGKVEKRFIIHQEGRSIPTRATEVHKITTAMSNDPNKTQPASYVYREIIMDALDCVSIIGHNTYFDVSIIKANILRLFGPDSEEHGKADEAFHKDKRLDTMRGSQKLFGRWPRLTELHSELFKEKFKAHSALDDARACERCYKELIKRKIM